MNKAIILVLVLFASYANADIKIELPKEWHRFGSVIFQEDRKIGEVISKTSWLYDSGDEFIAAFRKGFFDDPEATRFISSGKENDIYWACRVSDYEGSRGEFGIWYVRTLWVSGPILIMYSYESCDENMGAVLELAQTLTETNGQQELAP